MKIAFLDRDGVVNIDSGYVFRVSDFHFTELFFTSCKILHDAGYSLVIVTNQSGIARGYYSEVDFAQLSSWLKQQFVLNGLKLDAIYHCPHGADATCDCRKPKPGMVLKHLALTGALAKDCIMFGDKASDRDCAINAGLGQFFMVDITQKSSHFYDLVMKLTQTTAPSQDQQMH